MVIRRKSEKTKLPSQPHKSPCNPTPSDNIITHHPIRPMKLSPIQHSNLTNTQSLNYRKSPLLPSTTITPPSHLNYNQFTSPYQFQSSTTQLPHFHLLLQPREKKREKPQAAIFFFSFPSSVLTVG